MRVGCESFKSVALRDLWRYQAPCRWPSRGDGKGKVGARAWHDAQILRHRRDQGPDQRGADDRGDGAARRPGGGRAFPARRPSPPGGDRQGHAAFRLYDGDRADLRLHQRRHGRGDGRAGADAGGGDADPLDARRSRRDDLGQPQQVRRQRHQVVRARRLQAVRQGRDWRSRRCSSRSRALVAGRGRSAGRARSRTRAAATSTPPSSTFPEHLRLDGLKIVVDCANGAAYQVAPSALWELGAEVVAIGVSPNGLNINDGCGSTDTEPAQAHGGRERRRYRPRARRRRRPADRRRREGRDGRRRPADGADRLVLAAARAAARRRRRRDGDVQPRPRALPRRRGAEARAHPGRRPLRARGDARRAATMSAASNPATSSSPTMRPPATGWSRRCRCSPSWSHSGKPASELLHLFEPLPQLLKNVRFDGGAPLESEQRQGGDRRRRGAARRAAAGW